MRTDRWRTAERADGLPALRQGHSCQSPPHRRRAARLTEEIPVTLFHRLVRTAGVLTLLAAVPLASAVITPVTTGFGWS